MLIDIEYVDMFHFVVSWLCAKSDFQFLEYVLLF